MKRPAMLLALALLLLTFTLLTYRMLWLGYPIFPTAPGRTWQLSIHARITAEQKEVRVVMGLPSEHAGRMLLEERISSAALPFNLLREGANRMGVWSGIVEPGVEEIAYRATIVVRPGRFPKAGPPTIIKYPPAVNKEEQALAERLSARWNQLAPSARLLAIAASTRGEWGTPPSEDRDLRAWAVVEEKYGRLAALEVLFQVAGLPARPVEGIRLEEGIRISPLTWIEVWDGQKWESIMLDTGNIARQPASLLPLAIGGMPAIRIEGGALSGVRWSVSRQIMSRWRLHFERISRSDRLLDRWSLFRLPPDFQETFRILLLVPIGALLIGMLRNLAGFPTFGIFMPVLMALAFRNTGLAYGLGLFAGVLLVGYAVRRLLDRLRLLLVPRMSVILTLVITCFTMLALIGNKFGLREFMAVGLLPFVILTMVIERFFVLIEEAGVREGLRTAAGSAAVSVISYAIISWEPLQLTFFVYPELLAAVAAFQILLGRYTGYRLSELFRFRTFRSLS